MSTRAGCTPPDARWSGARASGTVDLLLAGAVARGGRAVWVPVARTGPRCVAVAWRYLRYSTLSDI